MIDDEQVEWFPAPGIVARRGDEVIENRSNLGDQEILALALLTVEGLGRMPTREEADVVVRWAVRARRDGGTQAEALRGVLELGLAIVPHFDGRDWLILPQISPELLNEAAN